MNEAKRSLSSLILRSYNTICFKAISPSATFVLLSQDIQVTVCVYSLIVCRVVCFHIASIAIHVMPYDSGVAVLDHAQYNSGSAPSAIQHGFPMDSHARAVQDDRIPEAVDPRRGYGS